MTNDIDNMAPDELRRRLRDALAEIEALKRRLTPGATFIAQVSR